MIDAIDGRPVSESTLSAVLEMFERPVRYRLAVRRGQQTLDSHVNAENFVMIHSKLNKEKHMKKVFVGFLIVMALAASSLYAEQKSVAGSWNVSIESISIRLVLAQKGKKITGTLQNPHGGEIRLKGQFAGGKIQFSGASEDNSIKLSAAGNLKGDGTLAGNLTSTMGDMAWSAVLVGH